MATLIHFDVNAENPERAKKFYGELLGWKFTMLPGPANYQLIETADLRGQKGIGGGLHLRERGPAGIINYFGVASIDASLEKVRQSGGKVITSRQEVPGWGYLGVCLDTEGNPFGLFEETV
jgi:uncharacterized protein